MKLSTRPSCNQSIPHASKNKVACPATRFARRSVIARPTAAGYRPRYDRSRDGAAPVAHEAKGNTRRPRAVRPNPSLKLSTNGMSRCAPGAGPAAQFAPVTQRATPLAPA